MFAELSVTLLHLGLTGCFPHFLSWQADVCYHQTTVGAPPLWSLSGFGPLGVDVFVSWVSFPVNRLFSLSSSVSLSLNFQSLQDLWES